MINDLGIIFKVYLISLALQFLVWPWVSKWFEGLTDKGWALGRIVSLLSIGLPIWFLGRLWPVNTDAGVGVVILGLVLVGVRSLQTAKTTKGSELSFTSLRTAESSEPFRKMILVEEGLFLLGFLGLSLIRGFQPNILGLEKFMDFGFIKQYLVSSKLPVNDMWLAGEAINYYSFGHFLVSILVRIWGVELEVGYNLMLAWILGTSLVLSFSVIVNLLLTGSTSEQIPRGLSSDEKSSILGGVMGALLTCLGGNSHVWWYLIKNKSLAGYWYAEATRFIEYTIHEFPGYSFVVSDLHAHVLGLPVVLAFVLVLLWLWKTLRIAEGYRTTVEDTTGSEPSFAFGPLLLGVLLGVMAMTNSWDVAVYGLLLVVFGFVFLLRSTPLQAADQVTEHLPSGFHLGGARIRMQSPSEEKSEPPFAREKLWFLFKLGLVIGGVAVITALPWLLSFSSITEGIRLVDGRSPLWQLAVLWGGHVAIVAVAIFVALKSHLGIVPPPGYAAGATQPRGRNSLVLAMGVTALLLLLIPEILYVKDIYTTHQRANTMFKLTYQAFVLMSLLFGWVVGRVVCRGTTLLRPDGRKSPPRRYRAGLLLGSDPCRCLLLIAMVVLWGGLMLFPVQAFTSYYAGFRKYRGLDGLAWLRKDQEKWAVIEYLEKHRDGRNMVEAVGDSYSRLNSISAFSGVATVLGWRVHEWLWRGGYGVVRKREGAIRNFYQATKTNRQFLKKYKVGWIVVGTDEKKEYKVDEKELIELGKVVWGGRKIYLIKVD